MGQTGGFGFEGGTSELSSFAFFLVDFLLKLPLLLRKEPFLSNFGLLLSTSVSASGTFFSRWVLFLKLILFQENLRFFFSAKSVCL